MYHLLFYTDNQPARLDLPTPVGSCRLVWSHQTKMHTFTLTFALLVAMATAQSTTPNTPTEDNTPTEESPMEEWYPFKNPGEILPEGALTVPYILDIVGGFWMQYRLIDSYAHLCSEVLPELTQKIPEIGNMSDIWTPVCEEVISARNDDKGFNATEFCNALVALGSDVLPAQPNMTDPGEMPAMTGTDMMEMPAGDEMPTPGPDGTLELPVDLSSMLSPLLGSLASVANDLYGIDIMDPLTICPQAHFFLEPSLPKLIYDFGTDFLSTLLTTTVPNCDKLNEFLEGLGIDSTSELYPIMQEVEALVYKTMGFESREDLCENVTKALNDMSK